MVVTNGPRAAEPDMGGSPLQASESLLGDEHKHAHEPHVPVQRPGYRHLRDGSGTFV